MFFWGYCEYDVYLFFSSDKRRSKILNNIGVTMCYLRDELWYLFTIGAVSITNNVYAFRISYCILVDVMLISFYCGCIGLYLSFVVLVFLVNENFLSMFEIFDHFAERLFDPFLFFIQVVFVFSGVFADRVSKYFFDWLLLFWFEQTFTIRRS